MSATNRKGNRARPDGDYATPLWAAKIILPHLPTAKRILDPCAGAGNLLRAVREHYGDAQLDSLAGIELKQARVQEAEKIPGVTSCLWANALLSATEWNSPDLVIMNPPYKLAEVFVRRALNAVAPGGTVAVLLRIGFAAGIAREAFWAGKVADMAVLARRPHFEKIGNSTNDNSEYAWFIFGPASTGRWFRLEAPALKPSKTP